MNRPLDASEAKAMMARSGVPNVEVSTLSNGMKVVTEHMPHLQSAAVGVWVRAGSRDEREGEHGIAHMLEHMAFKGTRTRSARDIAEAIENVGGDINAATSTETTSYYARVLRDDVPLAIDIIADILTNAVFDPGEMEREAHVILQEIGAALDTPDDLVFDRFQETAFEGQPLGRPIMGTPESVSGLTPDHLRRYLSDHYAGPHMLLAAAGAVDHDEVVALCERSFAPFGAKGAAEPVPGRYTGGEARDDRKLMESHVLLGFEGKPYGGRDFYASQFLAMILGGGMSSRLFQEVREKRGLCYAIYSFHWAFRDTGLFGIHAATGPEDVAELVPVILDEIERSTQTIDSKEVERARTQISAGLLMSMESPAARAGQIARQMLLFGRVIGNEELMDRLSAITPERLQDLAIRTFSGPPTIAGLGPIEGLAPRDEIANRLARLR